MLYQTHFLYRLIVTWNKIKRQYALVVGLRVTNGNPHTERIHHPPIEDGRLLPNSVKGIIINDNNIPLCFFKNC